MTWRDLLGRRGKGAQEGRPQPASRADLEFEIGIGRFVGERSGEAYVARKQEGATIYLLCGPGRERDAGEDLGVIVGSRTPITLTPYAGPEVRHFKSPILLFRDHEDGVVRPETVRACSYAPLGARAGEILRRISDGYLQAFVASIARRHGR